MERRGSSVATVWRPSPNKRPRQGAESLRYVILHGTWMTSDAEALARLTDPVAEVSCHYYISRDGTCTQLVNEDDVAWHAGASTWEGLNGLNAYSLGIEVGNAGPFTQGAPSPEAEKQPFTAAECEPYTEAQTQTLIALLKDIQTRHPNITGAHVLGHSQISPGRKTDPGPHFPWQALIGAGVVSR